MIARIASLANRRLAGWLAVGVCASVALLSVLAYRAVREWQRTATLLAERHAQEGADLLVLALTRDMRGAQGSVLSSPDWSDSMPDGGYDLTDLVASTFARFPYTELFFAWRGLDSEPSGQFYARSERLPSWINALSAGEAFPVVIGTAPAAARQLAERVSIDVGQRRRFSIFDVRIGDEDYQVVARLQYRDPFREELQRVFGFMVNLNWARRYYFPEVARQVARIVSADPGLVFSMYPEREGPPEGSTDGGASVIGRRVMPMAFFDPFLITVDPPSDLAVENWTLQARLADDATLRSARVGARRTLTVVAIGGTVFAAGLALTLFATRSHARLAQLRADFVATVTHELKTPIATIRAAAETLLSRRLADSEASHRYAQLMVDESKQLTRLLDNLLAYARIADTADVYSFQPVAVDALIDQSLRKCRSRLDAAGFEVHVDIPADLPPVRADWTAVCLTLDNLVDNAIRYSRERHSLHIGASLEGDTVTIQVTDRGIGIPAGEISDVTRKFFRGSVTSSGGSGLGLAIVERIATDHGGSLSIQSSVGVGTTVALALPVSRTLG
jgi:signal transduction histidine kinase